MSAKLATLVLSLVAAITLFSSLEVEGQRYLSFTPGEDELKERCFLENVLKNEIIRFRKETVVEELKAQLAQVTGSGQFKTAQPDACQEFKHCLNNLELIFAKDLGGYQYDKARCGRWAKFDELCKLMGERIKSVNLSPAASEQAKAVQDWLCQVSKEIVVDLDDPDNRCQQIVRQLYREAAGSQFRWIAAYDQHQLEEAKLELAEEIELEMEEKAIYDREIAERAFKKVQEEVDNYLGEFKACLKMKKSLKKFRFG